MGSVVISLFSFLIFILTIPHTIALRNLVAVLLLVSAIYIWLRNKEQKLPKNKDFKQIILLFGIFTLYLVLHTFFIADEFDWSFDELRAQWFIPLLYFIIGILLAFISKVGKYFDNKTLITALFFAMFLHILYVDFVAIDNLLQQQTLISRYGGLTGSPVLANYLTNILLAFVIAEFIYRIKTGKTILKINNSLLLFILVACIFSSVVEGMRFGMIALFFLTISAIILFSIDNRANLKHKILYTMFFIILISVPLLYNAFNDNRWSSLIETIPIALDTENNKHWLDRDKYPIPTLSDGSNVSGSNYERMAWAYQGLKYIIKDPIGLGYGRNAFGHAVQKYENYDKSRGKHSHSSIIDLTIGIGIVGIILWLGIFAKIIIFSFRKFIHTKNYYALITLVITSGFLMRSIVDSNIRDHMLLQFMLMLGISIVLMFYNSNDEKNSFNPSK
jgi:hypothetical protein